MDREGFINDVEVLCEKAGGVVGLSLIELKSGEKYEHNADWVLTQPASTVKLGLLNAALYKVQEGLGSLDDILVCGKDDKTPGSGVLQHLKNGTEMPLSDMLMLMIIQSDNSATNLVIDYLGFDYINGFFDMCGLPNIRVRRKMFDLEGLKKGIFNEASPAALTRLLYDLEKRVYLKEEYASLAIDILLKQQIYSIKRYISKHCRVASKSGSVDNAEHDCGIIYTPNATIILSVMTMDIPSFTAKDFIGRVAELAVKYFDPGCVEK